MSNIIFRRQLEEQCFDATYIVYVLQSDNRSVEKVRRYYSSLVWYSGYKFWNVFYYLLKNILSPFLKY